jgi:hypothetical protein
VLRRTFLAFSGAPLLAAAPAVRGRLTKSPGGAPALAVDGGRLVEIEGDADTLGVLNDERLAGADFEALGEFLSPARFRALPIHKPALYVYKDGKRFAVTYWCEKCAIRTYTPGTCWCCQEDTAVDLRENDERK